MIIKTDGKFHRFFCAQKEILEKSFKGEHLLSRNKTDGVVFLKNYIVIAPKTKFFGAITIYDAKIKTLFMILDKAVHRTFNNISNGKAKALGCLFELT